MTSFIECESLSITYSVGGIATVSYTLISDNADKNSVLTSVTAGNQTFSGHITNIDRQPIPNTEKDENGPWYTSNVTMFAITN